MSAASEGECEGRTGPTQTHRRGRASILLPVAVAAVAAVAGAIWMLRAPPGEAPAAPAPQASRPPPETSPNASPALRYEIGAESQPERPTQRIPPEARPRADERTRFAGTGVLEGRLRLPPGVPAPRTWSVVIAPSPVLIGGEHARPMREELTDGELEFSLTDVPLGGYEVWAEAEGMSGHHEHLLLARPDATLVYQDLRLVPLAIVEGRVVDEDGVGAAGLPMFLRPLAGSAALETRADGAGNYRFERVPDGEYRIEAGFTDASLAPVRELAVVSPSLRVPTLEVPRLHEVVALVLDDEGLPLSDALVRGWCRGGGRVEARSDAAGLARQPWIATGRLTLEALVPERPEAGHVRLHVDFPTPDGAPIELRLRR